MCSEISIQLHKHSHNITISDIPEYLKQLHEVEQDLEEKNIIWEVIWWPKDTQEPL